MTAFILREECHDGLKHAKRYPLPSAVLFLAICTDPKGSWDLNIHKISILGRQVKKPFLRISAMSVPLLYTGQRLPLSGTALQRQC